LATQLHYPPRIPRGGKPSVLQKILGLLSPLSWVYELITTFRSGAYRYGWREAFSAPMPIISVGNLTTGGTGKTPIVIALASGLVKAGKRVLILSRGYGATVPLQGVRADDPRYGDEAYLIQEEVPEALVLVGRRREEVLRKAMADYHPDYVILDDGFQYMRLKRTVNILLFDGEALIGNGRLLPLGPLRESMKALRRADIIFVTRSMTQETLDTVERWVRTYHPLGVLPIMPVPFNVAGLRAVTGDSAKTQTTLIQPEQLAARSIIAFSALARPEAFEKNLLELKLPLLEHKRFADHHAYSEADIKELGRIVKTYTQPHQAPPIVITTDKDWTKARRYFPSLFPEIEIYTLQTLPLLDGYWFYEEFLTRSPQRSTPEPPGTNSESPGLPHS